PTTALPANSWSPPNSQHHHGKRLSRFPLSSRNNSMNSQTNAKAHSLSSDIPTNKLWILTTCIPSEQKPCQPLVFTCAESALAAFDQMMREEWQYNAPDDDGGNQVPYPNDPCTAHAMMAAKNCDGSWGHWQLTAHIIGRDCREM